MNAIRKDSLANSVHKHSQKKRVSFADSASPSEPNVNRKLVEIIDIDSYKAFNIMRISEDEEQSQSDGHCSPSMFVTFDDENNYSLHTGSDSGNSCNIV